MNYKTLIERSTSFITSSGVAVTKFCKRVGMSPTHFYRWRNGEVRISADKAAAIDKFLKEFDF